MENGSFAAAKTNEATVTLVENMGDENYIYLTLDSNMVIVKTKSETVPKIGDRIRFSFEEEAMHLFDADSKASLKI